SGSRLLSWFFTSMPACRHRSSRSLLSTFSSRASAYTRTFSFCKRNSCYTQTPTSAMIWQGPPPNRGKAVPHRCFYFTRPENLEKRIPPSVCFGANAQALSESPGIILFLATQLPPSYRKGAARDNGAFSPHLVSGEPRVQLVAPVAHLSYE